MFGGPLFGPDVQPAQQRTAAQPPINGPIEPPLEGPEGAAKQPYGFEQALSDFLDFVGMGGTEQAATNQTAAEEEAYARGESPYQPRESANIQDRTNYAPDPEGYKRYADDPKQAAARISLMPRGVVPFVASAYDVATGRSGGLNLNDLYHKRQLEADFLEADQKPAVSAMRGAAPFIAGAVTGALAPARGLMGTLARGGLMGGATGAVEGYFDPSNDTRDLGDPGRLGMAAKMGGLGTVMGASTAGPAHLVRRGGEEIFSRMRARNQPNTQAQPAPAPAPAAVTASREKPLAKDWDRMSPAERREIIFEQRFQRGLKLEAERLGISVDDLRQRMQANRRKEVFGTSDLPESPKPPKPSAPVEPSGLNAAPEAKPAKVAKPEPKPVAPSKPKGPITKGEFAKYRASARGKDAMADIQRKGLEKETRSDAQMLGNEVRPLADVTGVRANVRIQRDETSPEVRFNAPRERGSYTPTQKKGLMEIADGVSAQGGRSPSKWDMGDKEEFIRSAARHTSMSPAKIKSMLVTYGEGTRAKRNLSNARVRELVEAERVKARKE